jgi:tetratricopeptide (TPR) repeat protein
VESLDATQTRLEPIGPLLATTARHAIRCCGIRRAAFQNRIFFISKGFNMIRSIVGVVPTFVTSRSCLLALVLGLGGSLSASDAAAQSQLTKEALIGDAVSELGRYNDIDEAIKRFQNRDVLGARRFLESAKEKDPNLPPTDLTLAKMYFLSGNAAAGRASLEKAAQDNPADPEAYLILADQAITQGRSIEAEALYEKALQLTEAFDENAKRKRSLEIRARTGRAIVAERRRQWQAAANDLQALLELDPDNATGHYRLGQALFMLDKASEGYREFVKSEELDENMPNPYVSAALMYDRLDDMGRARQAFERAIQEDKSDATALASYAQWLIKTGSIENAETTLDAARQANPESLDILILSGVAASMAKKMKPAEDYFMQAHGKAPTNGTVINQLALLLIDQPDEDKRRRALEFAGMNAKLNNENAEAQVTLAWVLYQLGRMADAEAALRNALQLGNMGPDGSYLVAKMLSDRNQADAARQILENALSGENQGIFLHRKEAEELLDTLGS